MIEQTTSIDQVIALLNEATKADPTTMATLIEYRNLCNHTLANHPTIQCVEQDGQFWVGLLGILNGIFGVDELGRGGIVALYTPWCPKESCPGVVVVSLFVTGQPCPKCGTPLLSKLRGFGLAPWLQEMQNRVVLVEQTWTCVQEETGVVFKPDLGAGALWCGPFESLEYEQMTGDQLNPVPGDLMKVRKVRRGSASWQF